MAKLFRKGYCHLTRSELLRMKEFVEDLLNGRERSCLESSMLRMLQNAADAALWPTVENPTTLPCRPLEFIDEQFTVLTIPPSIMDRAAKSPFGTYRFNHHDAINQNVYLCIDRDIPLRIRIGVASNERECQELCVRDYEERMEAAADYFPAISELKEESDAHREALEELQEKHQRTLNKLGEAVLIGSNRINATVTTFTGPVAVRQDDERNKELEDTDEQT